MPTDISSKEIDLWWKNIDELVSCYDNYCQTVCGGAHLKPEEGGKRHAEKWNEFKAALEIVNNIGRRLQRALLNSGLY